MNYFEFYGGDYLRDTTRLSLTDHGVYLRLLIAYYAEEEPLPAAHGELYTIAGATSAADKAAVRKVADKYFPVGDDGVRRNGRADEEIAKASGRMDAQPSDRKSSQAERAKRYRDRRAAMFTLLRDNGVVLEFNASAEELEAAVMALASRNGRDEQRDVKRDDSRDERDDVRRDVTASRPQTPDPTKEPLAASTPSVGTSRGAPTDAGRACLLMRQAGCPTTNPSHPHLLAALGEGVTSETLGDAAAEGVSLGKSNPFTWAIATARSRHAEALKQPTGGTHATRSHSGRNGGQSLADRSAAVHDDRTAGRSEPAPGAGDVLEGTATRVAP